MISCFLVLKLLGCGSHNSARHRHRRPPHAIAGTSTAQIYINYGGENKHIGRHIGEPKQTPNISPSVQIRGPNRKEDGHIGGLLPRIKTASDSLPEVSRMKRTLRKILDFSGFEHCWEHLGHSQYTTQNILKIGHIL